ncbi:hypothetical protein SGLAM104S_09978 [Streptomyces glaucescens]
MTEVRPAAAASASLWERDRELDAVRRAVDDLCADHSSSGSLLVFRGEAGLGKTALLAETRRIAEERGCTVWSARGGETLKSVPYNVVRQLLQPALVTMLPEEARDYLGDWYDIAGPALGIADPGDRQADPQGVCDGLVAAVRRLAERDWPLVLLIDDAHWADQETLRWLAAFAERLHDLSVLVVVARRPGEVTGPRARHLDAIAATAAQSVATLSALTPDAVAGLTRATVGAHADGAFCREVWAVTDGNPYDTVELLAKVLDSELDPTEGSAGELRALNRSARGGGLVARLEGLGIDATRFAWAAAILGTGITVDLVARLTTLSLEQAERCAELLTSARILTPPDPAGGQASHGDLEFVHPLIATAVYHSIPDALRRAMHGIAAQIVTDFGLGAAAASRHLLQVHPDDDAELVDQLREAAREHLAVGAPDAARRCLERALPGAAPARGAGSRPLRTGLRDPAHRAGQDHRPPADRARPARSRRRRTRRRGHPALPGPAPQRPAGTGRTHHRGGGRPARGGARADAAAGRAVHVGGHLRRGVRHARTVRPARRAGRRLHRPRQLRAGAAHPARLRRHDARRERGGGRRGL